MKGNLPISIFDNRTIKRLKNEYNEVLPFQLGIFAVSGQGKGLSGEGIIERWKEQTKGIVIYLADPKNEGEGTFCQYKPEKEYHLDRLERDGSKLRNYKCKMYHPFTFNIPKGFLPDINFYSTSIKDLTREEWGILIESDKSSETTRLIMRVADNLNRNHGLFPFLHEVQSLTQGKKDKKKAKPDPKNFHLSVGGGTAKSVTEVANLLAPFKTNYFIRKDSCPNKLDWKAILKDNESYHVFLSMWLHDDKIKQFCVLSLLKQIINNINYATKPVLLVIPEMNYLCPRNPKGYKEFLSIAIADSLRTIRSKSKGMSTLIDGQSWDDMDDKVKGALTDTFFGKLSTKGQEIVVKAMGYTRGTRLQLQNMGYCTYLHAGNERDGAFRIFPPRHMHREVGYDWIQMYKENFPDSTKRYDELVNYMREEIRVEEDLIVEKVRKKQEKEEAEEEKLKEERKAKKEGNEKPKKEKKAEKEDKEKEFKMKLAHERFNDLTLPKKERGYRAIGRHCQINHVTAKKYIEEYDTRLNESKKPVDISHMIGDGVMQEEIDEMVNQD